MPDRRCARCEFTGDLTEHATVHPCCLVCARSLHRDETQTCGRCVGQTRADLADILDLYARLPAELEHHARAPIPGGNPLVMLAAGNTHQHVRGAGESEVDFGFSGARADDPEPVLATLTSWWDDWLHVRGERPAMVEATVSTAVGFLTGRLRWAAERHPVFDEFTADVGRLLRSLLAVTRAGPQFDVPCTRCDVPLLLELSADGRTGVYRCPRCRRRYDEQAYWVAVHQHLVEQTEAVG